MRRIRTVLLLLCLLLLACCLATAEEAWPPEGKEEGRAAAVSDLSGNYYFNYEGSGTGGWSLDLYPQGSWEDSQREAPVTARLTRLSGDDGVGEPFSVMQQGEDWGLSFQQKLVQGEGEATYRLEVATEHYWYAQEFTARFRDTEKMNIELLSETISCTVGEPVEGGRKSAEIFVRMEPAEENNQVYFRTPEGNYDAQTDQYEMDWSTFTAKEPGDYLLNLSIRLGKNEAEIKMPVTMHVISREKADAAWEASWPPADRQKAAEIVTYSSSTVEEDLNGTYFIHGEDHGSIGTAPFYLKGEDGTEEAVTSFHITFISGDEHLRRLILQDQYGNGEEANLRFYLDDLTGPGTAEYRIDMTSEHYWASETAKPVIMDVNAVQMELLSSDVYVPLGEMVNIPELFEERAFIRTEPEFEYHCSAATEGGGYEEETASYRFEGWRYFTAAEAGDYPLTLNVSIGQFGYTNHFPITVHASAETKTAAVEGEAPLTAMAIRKQEEERKRLTEELQVDQEAGDVLFETEDAIYVYRLKGDTATIQKILPLGTELTVPAVLDGHPVVGIDGFAMEWQGRKLKKLTLEEGIRTVGKSALHYLEQLEYLKLPESLTQLEMYAIADCHALQELSLPKSLTLSKIGMRAFEEIGLDDLILANGTSLMTESLKAYRQGGMYDEGLKMIAFAEGFDYLVREDGGAIVLGYDYDVLQENGEVLILPETVNGHPVREIGQGVFRSNSGIREAVLPEGLEVIGAEAFRKCEKLASVRIPSTVKEIGSKAFLGIGTEEAPILPEGVTSLAADWFAVKEKQDATGRWTYRTLTDGTAAICGFTYEAKLEFPAEVDGLPVSEITGPEWYSGIHEDQKKVKQLILPEGLKSIGERAFSGLTNLTKVTLPATLTRIGEEAFYNSGLTALTLPEGIEEIGTNAFASGKLKSVSFPSTLRHIGEKAFSSNKLSSLKLPEGLESIGKEAFTWCEVSNLQLPQSLKTIGEDAFYSHKLNSLTIPAGVERVGNGAFRPNGKATLKKITFEGAATELGKGIFGYDDGEWEYYSAHQAEIQTNGGQYSYDRDNPDNWIDYYAEESRHEPQELSLTCYPGSTADRLYQYHVKKTYPKWGAEHIATTPADPVLQAGLYTPADQIYEMIIPEGVEEIADNAFEGLVTLNKLKLPSTLKRIGNRAFADCTALAEVTLPKDLERIGTDCFNGCGQLTKINLPKGITEIPAGAFRNCAALKQATLQNAAIVRIGDFAFAGCKALTSFQMGKGLETIGVFAFQDAGLKNAQVPDTVTEIGAGAFAGSDITSLTLPKGLTEIPMDLCSMCWELKSVKIPAEVRAIGNGAFMYCRSLNGLNLPEGLETIGEGAFMQYVQNVQYYYSMSGGKKRYTSLSSIKFPASLKTIGKNAFVACDALGQVTFAKGSQLTEIGVDAFAMCLNLKEITLPDSLETVGNHAFVNCIGMKKANLGAGLQRAGEQLFRYCADLTELTVPDTLTEIGDNLLEGHGAKLKVTCGEGSAMEAYLQAHYPDVTVVQPKKK